jgi:hypothetical protein
LRAALRRKNDDLTQTNQRLTAYQKRAYAAEGLVDRQEQKIDDLTKKTICLEQQLDFWVRTISSITSAAQTTEGSESAEKADQVNGNPTQANPQQYTHEVLLYESSTDKYVSVQTLTGNLKDLGDFETVQDAGKRIAIPKEWRGAVSFHAASSWRLKPGPLHISKRAGFDEWYKAKLDDDDPTSAAPVIWSFVAMRDDAGKARRCFTESIEEVAGTVRG